MENIDYRAGTGAWVGLVLAVAVAVGAIYLPFAVLKMISAIIDIEMAVAGGIFLLPLWVTCGLIVITAIVAVICYTLILVKRKSGKNVVYTAVIAAAVTGALTLMIGLGIVKGQSGIILSTYNESAHALAIALTISGISWILAVTSVLQIEKIEDRKIGCLLMIAGAVAGGLGVYLLTKLIYYVLFS